MIFEFGEYCFIKWKFKFWNFLSEIRNSVFSISQIFGRSIEAFVRSIKMMKKIILKSLDGSITIRFLFDQPKRTFDRYSIPLDRSKLVKLIFLQNFLVTILNVWRDFKPCEWLYEIFWLSIRTFWWNITLLV